MGIMNNSSQDLKKYGLRIYTIIKNGPLDKSGVKELTDFIIPPEEVLTSQISFLDWVQTHSNQEVVISFYSLLTKKFRDVKIKTNPLGSKEGVLGASVGKENWTTANKNVLHVISVKEDSFAKKELGLIPNEDYITGVKCMSSPIIPLNHDEFSPLEILSEVINKNKGNPVKFYIYNKIKGARDVTVVIGKDYYFSLGLEGAFGALHMFPSLDMEKNEVNNDIKEIKDDNQNVNNNKDKIENKEISKESNKVEIKENNKVEIKESNENIEINKQNDSSYINENNNNNINIDNKEKTENETKENNFIIKEENLKNRDNKEENSKEIHIEKDLNNKNEVSSNNNEQKQIILEETNQVNKKEILTSNNENINKIVEEISVEKNLETTQPQEDEESKKEIKEQNQTKEQESTTEINKKENDNIEEIKIEIKEEQKKEEITEIKENKENNDTIKTVDKKEEENNNKENEIKQEINSEDIKKEEKEEEKEEKEDENKNNTNQSSGNKNKRRKKRNKH